MATDALETPCRVHEAIEAQTRRTPERTAIVAGTTRLSYAELNRRADDVAHALSERGAGPGGRVGVCLDRGEWLIPALVGVWKAGAAYVPLDPAYPAERLRFMIEDAAVTAVLTSEALRPAGTESILIEDVKPGAGPFHVAGDPGDPAYVIYTSGSTGTPKGVVVEHRNTMNLLRWEAAAYTAEELGGMLAGASVCFDPSISQLFLPLVAGGTVILADNLLALPTLPARDEVTTVYGVPSALAVLLRDPLPAGVRAVFSGGEPLTGALVRRIYANPGVRRVLNLYGPTECTTTCAVAEVGRDRDDEPPLGEPIAGAVFSVRDARGAPVPDGEPGELWIGGPVVTRGYLGHESAAFRTEPDGTRVYRSGDMVRRVAGELRFAGRADDQVKIRGYRVEPGEVEAALSGHPAVRGAAVLAAYDGDGVASLVGHVAATGVGEPELREWLLARLPGHLVPTRIGVAGELPLGPNGKVDRAALPELRASRSARTAPVAPRDDDERLVTEVIAGVLGLPEDEVGVHDRFAELGGHSLAAARVVIELSRRLGRTVPLAAFLTEPTAAGLARRLAQAGSQPVRRSGRTRYPLTGMQREFWTLRQLHPHAPVTTLGIRLRVRGPHDAAALNSALDAVVRRHEVLRSTVAVGEDGVPYSVVHPPASVTLLKHAAGEDPEKVARAAAAHVFDVTSEVPLLRAHLCPLGEDAELVVVVDHLAFDGASAGVLMSELAAELAGRPVPGPAVQVGDVAVQEQERSVRPQEFWRDELAGAPVAGPPPADLTTGRVIRPLPEELLTGVSTLARESDATPFAVYLAALGLAGGEPDTLVGMVAARRAGPELSDVIGPLVDTLPVRLRPTGALTFRDLVGQAAAATTRALLHQEIPPAELPRAPILLAMQHADVPVRLDGLELLTDLGSGAAGHELSVLVNQSVAGAELQLEYGIARLDAGRAEAYLDRLLWLLRCALDDPDRPLPAFDLVTPDERAALLALATGPELPDFPATVPQALAAHTGPVAVVGPDGASLGYTELRAWSGRVSAGLREHGVRPGDVVGVCLPRDHLMPAVLLAVWGAGAAYLPLDPEHPAERLRWLAQDAGVRVVLTRGGLPAVPGVTTVDADHLATARTGPVEPATARTGRTVHDGPAVPHTARPDDLAYVLYTSGSTGKPKGVEVTHGNLAAYVAGLVTELGLGPEIVQPAVAPLTFDTSASELWVPLSIGGTCVVVDRATAVDGHALAGRIADVKATVIDLVPTTYRMLLAAGWAGDPGLIAITGGEALDPALAGQILPRAGKLWNTYGPTEATVASIQHELDPHDTGPVPIGRPMPGERAYVVDSELRLVPPGAIGELLLGGAGVARGYRGRPDLTAAAYVDDPFVPGGRCYRTGDLARWRPDGTLEFHGRRDHQVKVRGYRIELGEIEAVLREVADGVVTVTGEGAEAHLVGHVAPETADLAAAERHLRARLPGHMVPRRWVALPGLPTLPNGKVDRAALPEPDDGRKAERAAPGTDSERLVATIWAAVLDRPAIWADDDFFALGGHSFAATRVASRLRETLGLAVPVRLLFERPLLADFAAGLEDLLIAELMNGSDA